MNVRQTYLELQRAVADAESLVWNLSGGKPITAIELRFDATSNTPDGGAFPLLTYIDNLQVVDGSRIIQGGGGQYLQGMQHGMGHKIGWVGNSENTTAERGETIIKLFFGRFYGDTEYFLDPKKLSNPQLKFTSALVVGAGDWTTGSLRVSIIIHTLEDPAVSPKGMLTVKEIIAATIAANAEERTDMPTDNPWWTLGMFCESAAKVALAPVPTLLSAKLSVDHDSYIPFDLYSRDILSQNIRDLGVFSVLEEEMDDWAVNQGQGLVLANITLESKYVCPYGGIFVPFSSHMFDDGWNPGQANSVRLIKTGGGTGGVVRVFLAELSK